MQRQERIAERQTRQGREEMPVRHFDNAKDDFTVVFQDGV